MQYNIYQIDAFTETIFGGNPACVVPLESWLSDAILLKITQENAVAETAFYVINGDKIHLRWFTPEIEMDLCGHATLATAHVLISILNYPKNEIIFETLSGDLMVTFANDLYTLDFPSRKPITSELPEIISKALNIQPLETLKSTDYVLVFENESDIKNIKIDRQIFDKMNLETGGVIITAKGENSDFVSRFFTPQASILEDPVTGSAHCSLIPYWSEKLNKTKLSAIQLSERKGFLSCEQKGNRVLISGKAKTYLIGSIFIE
jgi:PhzF family phenazine biosynthesis protein